MSQRCATWLGLVLSVSWGVARAAPAGDEGAAAGSQAPDAREREVRRVLRLASGETVRATSRWRAGLWEVKRNGAWKALPEGSVVGARLASELEREHQARARAADDGDAHAALARWDFEQGLLEEGLVEVEAALEREPDHAAARAALGEVAHRFAVPRLEPQSAAAGAGEQLLDWSATRARASQELAVLELARVRDREGLRASLAEGLASNTAGRRRAAALALRRLFPGQELEGLLRHAVLDPAEEVRHESSWALATAGRPELVFPVARALESAHPTVRLRAAEALGEMGYPAAVAPLVARLAAVSGSGRRVPHAHVFFGTQSAYIQDFDVEVAQNQAVADPQVNVIVRGVVLDAGIHSSSEARPADEARALRGALAELTGESPGRTDRAWLDWWDERGEAWLRAHTSAQESRTEAPESDGAR